MTGRRGRRHQEFVTVAWITSVIVVICIVVSFLESLRSFGGILVVILGIVIWRKYGKAKREGAARQRESDDAANRARAAKEAADKQRAEQAARDKRDREAREAREAADAKWRATQDEYTRSARAEWEAEAERYRAGQERAEAEVKRAADQAARSGDLDFILALSPTQFEYTMAAMLRMIGMTDVQRVGGRGDLGVDITARDPVGRSMVVQCKRYARTKKIGSPDIQQFIGMAHVHHQADLKLFVTTSDFTNDARALASVHNIQLMNGTDIELLARRYRESNL